MTSSHLYNDSWKDTIGLCPLAQDNARGLGHSLPRGYSYLQKVNKMPEGFITSKKKLK